MSEGKKIKINRRNSSEDVKTNDQKPEEIEVTQTEDVVVKSIDDIEIPDIEMVENNVKESTGSIIKEQKVEKRKLFANKKANIALAVFTAIVIVVFALLVLF